MHLDDRRQKLFTKRSRTMYGNHRRRAKEGGQQLNYTLPDLRQFIWLRLDHGCRYCHLPLTSKLFSVDHGQPTSRGGNYTIDNLLLTCVPCNQYKGDLTEQEFVDLLALLGTWPAAIAKRFLARVRAGSRFFTR